MRASSSTCRLPGDKYKPSLNNRGPLSLAVILNTILEQSSSCAQLASGAAFCIIDSGCTQPAGRPGRLCAAR
eukprot:16434804-Heterocapsa_arctica.AAC.1